MDRRSFVILLPASTLPFVTTASAQSVDIPLNDDSRREFERLLAPQEIQKRNLFAIRENEALPEGPLDRVYYWNNVILNLTSADHTPAAGQLDGADSTSKPDPRRFGEQFGPHRSSYALAIAQIAVFEAVNAFSKKYVSYTGYSTNASIPAIASLDAAIAQAAFDAAAHLYPFKIDDVRRTLDRDISRIPTKTVGGDAVDINGSRKVGQDAAKSIIDNRRGDGSAHQEIMFADLPADDGPLKWSPDPVSNIQTALGARWSGIRPFLLQSADQFRLGAPPGLTDPKYVTAFNEVKDIGRKGDFPTDTSRTDEQTFRANFWAYDGTPNLCAPPRLYNQLVRTLTELKKISDPSDLARILALSNATMADAAIAAWDSKYTYRYWRPVTAIRWPGPGGDASNVPEASWEPLGAPDTDARGPNFTPPFPAYPSGHATFGGALFQVLRRIFQDTGDRTPFVLVSDEYNGQHRGPNDSGPRPYLPLSFVTFRGAEAENAFSRVWLGVHWRFDGDDGVALGNKVGDWAFDHGFAPV